MASVLSKSIAVRAARLVTRPSKAVDAEAMVPLVLSAAPLVEQAVGSSIEIESIRVRNLSRWEWIDSNIDSYFRLMGQVLPEKSPIGAVELNSASLGLALGIFSTRVMGQYDPGLTGTPGILWMVEENIAELAKAAGVGMRETSLWVMIHELTHRAQFVGNPWLVPELFSLIKGVAAGSAISFLDVVANLVDALVKFRSLRALDPLAAFLPPDLHDRLERITSIMTVLEGQAEWVMRSIDRSVLPNIELLEQAVDRRRQRSGTSQLLSGALGVGAKQRQYRRGYDFFRMVASARPGLDRLVLRSAASIPLPSELDEPSAWIRRVVGNAVELA